MAILVFPDPQPIPAQRAPAGSGAKRVIASLWCCQRLEGDGMYLLSVEVDSGMICSCDDFKVLRSVVSLVPVDMVNDLFSL